MENLIPVLVGAAWLAIFAMLVVGVVSGTLHQLRNDAPQLPQAGRREARR
jgi:hypothetical protein